MPNSLISSTICTLMVLTILVTGCKSSTTTTATVTVSVSPTSANVPLGGTQQFTATTYGSTDTGVIWEVNGVENGNSTYGTISKNGLYTSPAIAPNPSTLSVTVLSHANNNDVANATVNLISGVYVSVSPSSVDLKLGQSQQFNATVSGTSNQNVTWGAGGITGGSSAVGTITSSGLYTAPASASTPSSVSVTATSRADTTKIATVSVTLHSLTSVTISPTPAIVQTFAKQQFAATVTGNSNTSVTWEVNGTIGGSAKIGTISQTGLYSAPNSVPTQASNGDSLAASVTVQAVSQADSSAVGSVTVTVVAANQKAQASPMSLGVSGGNMYDTNGTQCFAGTLGSLVSRGGNQFILSTNHVLARTDLGAVGDGIIQPGLTDASTTCNSSGTSLMANLSQFFNLENGSGTKVDAAIAQVLSGKVDSLGTILQLGGTTNNGQPTDGAPHAGSGVAPVINQAVAKSGRSTGLTCSTIEATDVTLSVQYQQGYGANAINFAVTYANQVQISGGAFSARGDTGSLIVTQDNADPVALLYASSDQASVGNPVADVLAAMANPSTQEKPVFVGSSTTHPVAACGLPGPQASASSTPQATAPSEALEAASTALNLHASELLALPEVQAVGVGLSLDEPGAPAVTLFVTKNHTPGVFPAEIENIRTKILKVDAQARRGVLSHTESAALERTAVPGATQRISETDIARARAVHSAHVRELMNMNGVQGVGISSSADNTIEAALTIYTIRGAAHANFPMEIDGVRTRIKESSRFSAGNH